MPRSKSGPRIYQRAGRRGWYAFIDDANKNISLGTEDYEEAKVKLADLIHRRALEGDVSKQSEIGDLFVACAERATVNHSIKHAYNLNLRFRHLAKWLDSQGITRPDKITLGLVEQFKSDERERGIKDRTINRYLDAWKKAMKHAVDDGIAPSRTLDFFRKLREPQHAPHQRGLTIDEIDSFLKAIDDERYYWMLRTVAGSGIRYDEVRHLEEQSVRGNAIVITPLPPGLCKCHPRGWSTKNYRHRSIPVTSETVECAAKYVAAKESMNLDKKHLWRRIQDARIAAGHTWQWSMHELRRAWGSHLLLAGQSLGDISRWYGHGDVKTTMRYLRVVDDSLPDPDDLPI